MRWQFTLIDRNNAATVIDEPVGWDALSIEIKRDSDTHGLMFDYQNNDLKYYDEAYYILKKEYNAYGSQGIMMLKIEERCEDGEFEELYIGKLNFKSYTATSSGECFIKIPLETTSDVIDLISKWDQKVDLKTLLGFDGITVLPAYNKLGFDLTLPSKAILLQNKANNKSTNSTDVLGPAEMGINGTYNFAKQLVDIGFSQTICSEIGGFYASQTPIATTVEEPTVTPAPSGAFNYYFTSDDSTMWYLDFISPMLNLSKDIAGFDQITGKIETSFRIKGRISVLNNCQISRGYIVFCRLSNVKDENGVGVASTVFEHKICPSYPPVTSGTIDFDQSFQTYDLQYQEGDMFYLFVTAWVGKTPGQEELNAYNIQFDSETFVQMNTVSLTPSSVAEAFLVNESISRVTEAITNNKIKAYSDYFGRIDSQPYALPQDGIGSLEALCKGIFIRNQQNRIAGQPNIFSLSMKDIWEGLEPIHHIGYGIENDANRAGHQCLRVENWKYFYQNNILMTCDSVNSVERKLVETRHYSTGKFGYEKYEAEQYNGLDEFLTKRTVRTTLNGLKNELSKLSKFIVSGYAWEITRRKNADSSDWRFDNDTFLVCLIRQNNGLEVELGNITSAANIIDPNTIYNFRLSPMRNAMRWMDKISEGYKTNGTSTIIFTDGEGNYAAEGKMTSGVGRLEANVLSEKQTIDITTFKDPSILTPIMEAEELTFDYPMSVKDFKTIKANPYGLIAWSNEYESGEAWISSIKYKPEEGLATFSLIPKRQ